MKHKLLLFSALLFANMAAMADVVVSGVVTDRQQEPVIGASVLEKGTGNGTVTDFDGRFTLSVSSEQATLVISYVGMKSTEVSAHAKSPVSIVLQDDTEALDEVVVIGYGFN